MKDWTKGLNPEQAEAVLHCRGPLLILAGAGSGKTTVLVARTGQLIEKEGVHPSRICLLTFTNKAARELKERLARSSDRPTEGLWAGTFHAFGLQFLRKHHEHANLPKNFGVIDAGDATSLVKELGSAINIAGKKDFEWEKVHSRISAFREGSVSENRSDDVYWEMAEVLMPKYVERLNHLGVVDFDELLLRPIEMLERSESLRWELQNHFQHMMVDEFQDTNGMQMRLVRLLVGPEANIAVVGDDDQSIYGWRGAQVQNILGFPSIYRGCKVVRLERNYRSTPEILNLANEVIKKNSKRHDKVLRPSGEAGGELPELFVYENEEEEAESVVREINQEKLAGASYEDIAILYRSNGQSALFEAELRKTNIPYKVSGGTAFFDRTECKDILAYLRCALRPNEVALRRILNTPPRGIGGVSIEAVTQLAATQEISFYKALCRWRQAGINDKSGAAMENFLTMINRLASKLIDTADSRSSGAILLAEMEECGYKAHIQQGSKDSEVFQKRWGLIQIFCGVLDRFVAKGGKSLKTLREFVEAMELRDSDSEDDTKGVQLMTLHASKGLEFPLVFLVGVEEDILPHKSLGQDTSEERRLFYVGLTRAKRKLILSRVRSRKRYGRLKPCVPSRFLLEIPSGLLRTYERGVRPLDEGQRKGRLEDLFSQLDSLAAGQKVR